MSLSAATAVTALSGVAGVETPARTLCTDPGPVPIATASR